MRERLVAMMARRQEAWDRRDVVALAASHAAAGVVFSPIFGTVRGRAAIEQSYRDLFSIFQDWAFTGSELVIDGLRVAEPFEARATHAREFLGVPSTGRRFDIHGVLLFRFEDDEIAEERRVYDFSGMLIQIGVLKAKPAS